MPLATAKAVITQVPWSDDTPRLPEMVGSETLAMVESSTCMKVPSASTSAVMPSWPPFSGAISAWGAGGRAAAAPCLPSTLPALADIRAVLPQDLGDQGIGHRAAVFAGIGAGDAGTDAGGDHGSGFIAHIDIGGDAQANTQGVIGQFLTVQRNAHRHTLHDLDPVAGGVLRRQQREGGTGTGAQALDMAMI